MSDSHLDRRDVLRGLAAASLVVPLDLAAGASADPRFLAAGSAREIDVETLARAQELLGLSFDKEQLREALPGVRRQVRALDLLRKESLQNSDAPAAVFRPQLRGSVPRRVNLRGVRALPDGVPERPLTKKGLAFAPVHVLARLLRARRLTSVEITRLCLQRLKDLDPTLHCVVSLTEERAMEEARRADEEMAKGRWRGPLHGVPYGLKDLFAVRGYRTTWGAKPFENQVIDDDAAVYERLRDAGAVLCAKLTMGALAMGDVWFGGRTRNPWNPEQGSSGSSAGSASAVAAGLLPFAIGTETLGSIVSPCTRCGATGLRPTFGRVSRHGAMALCWSLDKAGPITRSVRDLALVLDVLSGRDPRDRSTTEAPFRFEPAEDLSSHRIGYVAESFEAAGGERDDRGVAADRAVLDVLRKAGAKLQKVELPRVPAGLLRPILDVEAAAAFDEITRDGRVGEMVRQGRGAWPGIFRRARFYPAVEFVQACRIRQRLVEAWEDLMEDLDVIVAPTFRGNVLLPTNFTGHPTVVLPNGFGSGGKRPRSISFVGALMGEGPLLEVACRYQEATNWHLKRPPL